MSGRGERAVAALFPETGRADDLLSAYARAVHARGVPAVKSRFESLLLPPLMLLGRTTALCARAVPAAWFGGFHDLCQRAQSGRAARPFLPGPALRRAEGLLRGLRAGGSAPGLLCLLSHPGVDEEGTGLNVEIMRQGMLALRRLGGAGLRPRMLAALDAFALDTFPTPREGLYAGFMAGYHIGFDRQAHGRRGAQRLLMRAAAWPSVAFRLLRELRRGGGVVLMLGGGVPETARAHYALREALQGLRRTRPPGRSPAEVCAALPEGSGFADFRAGLRGGMRRSAWRALEAWLLAPQLGAEAFGCSLRGELAGETLARFRCCARAFGHPEAEGLRALEELRVQAARETPARARFFSLLSRRLAARGTPLLLLPLRHQGRPAELFFGEAEVLTPGRPFDAGDFVRRNFA